MTLKEALEKTIELHQMVIDGKYETYADAKEYENKLECPLCAYDGEYGCAKCPYVVFTGVRCYDGENYNRVTDSMKYLNSVGSLIRLRTWLSQVERWGLE